MSFRLFEGRIRTDESMQNFDELMELSYRRKWNVQFSLPDIGCYPNLKPIPTYRWASDLLYLIKEKEAED